MTPLHLLDGVMGGSHRRIWGERTGNRIFILTVQRSTAVTGRTFPAACRGECSITAFYSAIPVLAALSVVFRVCLWLSACLFCRSVFDSLPCFFCRSCLPW